MPLSRIKLLPVDPAGFEIAEPSWDWWDVDPGIKIVMAHLQAQGPSAAPSDVKRLRADANGNLLTAYGTPATPLPLGIFDGGNGTVQVFSTRQLGDATAGGNIPGVGDFDWNGTTWDRARTPNVFKVVALTAAGATAIWTPSAGKKFRLMKLMVQVPADVTVAAPAEETIQILDQGALFGLVFRFYVTAAIRAAGEQTPWLDLGNGYLSTAANNVLQGNLGTATTAGNIVAIAAGTEE